MTLVVIGRCACQLAHRIHVSGKSSCHWKQLKETVWLSTTRLVLRANCLARQAPYTSRMVVVAYLLCAVIWGTTWYAIRVCTGAGGFSVLDSLALRFVIASLVLVPLAWRLRPWPRGRLRVRLIAAGVLNAISFALVYVGEQSLPGAAAAVIYGTQPLILAVLLRLTGGERMTRPFVLGSLLALGGVTLLAWDGLGQGANQVWALAFMIGAVIVSTLYTIMLKGAADEVPALVTTTIFLATTAVLFVVAALIHGVNLPAGPPLAPTLALLHLALMGSVVAYGSYFWLLRHTDLKVVSTLVFVFPVVAIVIDLLVEKAPLQGARAYGGLALTLVGLALALFWKKGTARGTEAA